MAEVHGFGDIAVSPHALATQAAMEIYALGGNAVDAAIAANAVQGVVAPETCGVGGDLFALVWRPGDDAPQALNASGPAGSGADAASLRAQGLTELSPLHSATVTVPGCVAGWGALSESHGDLPLRSALTPAIRLAEDGFPASNELVRAFTARAGSLADQEAAEGIYPQGNPPRLGDRTSRSRLARVLRQIASDGTESFYRGEAAHAIADATSQLITLDDLSSYAPEWVDPLGVEVFGATGWTVPPNSQGYLVLAAARIFEDLDPPEDDQDPLWHHLLIEAYRAVAWERDLHLSDPRTSRAENLLDPGELRGRAAAIDAANAARWPFPRPARGGTAYLATLDRHGTGVSLIQSNFWGIGSNVGAAGFFLQNRGYGFTLEEGHPNELAPGRRPAHTLSPTLWTKESGLAGLLGTRGGNQQPQLLIQLAARLFRLGKSTTEAQAAPRWILEDLGATKRVRVEPEMPDRVVAGLESRGHTVEREPQMMGGWGPASVITVGENGLRTGAADPRVDTALAAVR